MLKFKTDGQELFYLDGGDVIVGDTIRYLEAEFDLSDDWKSFPEVTAYFKCGAAINSIILTGGKIKAEDNLALAPGVWSVYLRAYELEGEEIKRQITSSTVKINVLSHGKFTGREFVPENADAYEKRMTEMRNYLVFEEYNPSKKYVKGNKVSFEGSSYVLTAESAMGTNPTDSGAWLLIAEKGDDGASMYPFPNAGWEIGEEYRINFQWSEYEDDGGLVKEDYIGADKWKIGDFVFCENGIIATITEILRRSEYIWLVTFKCIADIKGKDGSTTKVVEATLDKNGVYNITLDDYDSYKLGDMFFVKCVNAAEANYENIKHLYIKINSLDTIFISNVPEDVAASNAILMPNFFVYYTETANIESISKRDAGFMMVNTIKEFIESDAVPEGKYANIDLSNVSDEDFKAKAEEAGVGGNAGLAGEGCVMKFIGEVSVLPETANDGEVYSVSPWTNAGEFFDASGTVITEYTIYFGGWSSIANFLYDDVQRYYGCTYKFVIGSREFIFKECGVSSAGPDGFEMSVNCTEQGVNYTIPYNSTVVVYRTDGEPKDDTSYVRFGNKWVKL